MATCVCGRMVTPSGACIECVTDAGACSCAPVERDGADVWASVPATTLRTLPSADDAPLPATDYDGAPHPADVAALVERHEGTAATTGRTVADINREFWDARHSLKVIRDAAHARIVCPWALLAEVLARVTVRVSPRVQLPGIIGGPVSLNVFFGIVAMSGGGKGGAANAVRDVIDLGESPIIPRGIGSGEGLPKLFVDPQSDGTQNRVSWAELVSAAEVDSWAAQVSRGGSSSTLPSQLRQAWMGETLGFHYANKDKRTHVPDQSYRMCLTIGIQPKRAGVLLGEADGGTPQRFIWWPARDVDMPADPPAPPAMLEWRPSYAGLPDSLGALDGPLGEPIILEVCDEATDVIRAEAIKRHHEPGAALDGHALLCREKLAAALAALDGHAGIRREDWELAGLGMEVSDLTRASIVDELSAEIRAANEASGYAEAARARIVQTSAERDKLRQAQDRIITVLIKNPGWWSHGKLRSMVGPKYRLDFDEAAEGLTESGRVRVRPTAKGHGADSTEYALAGSE